MLGIGFLLPTIAVQAVRFALAIDSDAINAPVLSQTSADGAAPFTWSSTVDETVYAGYFWRVQTSADGIKDGTGAYVTPIQDLTQLITPGDFVESAPIAGFATPSGTFYLHQRIERDDGLTSPWSSELVETITAASTIWSTTQRTSLLTLSNSNRTAQGTASIGASQPVRASQAASGKRQFEIVVDRDQVNSGGFLIGVEDGTGDPTTGYYQWGRGATLANGASLFITDTYWDFFTQDGAYHSGNNALADGDSVSVEFDTEANTCSFYLTPLATGVSTKLGPTITDLVFANWFAMSACFQADVFTLNTGQTAFARPLATDYQNYG